MSEIATIRELTLATSAETAAAYAELTQDFNPLHLDAEFAAATAFGVPIAHGTMALNLLLEALAATFGEGWNDAALVDVRFTAPVPVGQSIRTGGEMTGAGIYAVRVIREDGTKIVSGTVEFPSADAGAPPALNSADRFALRED